jgi:phosphoribosyl 1,2-cyclic phosphodiesterase
VSPTAIILTHAHPDHAFGLKRGAPCPVYATPETWALISRFPVRDRRLIQPCKPLRLGPLAFEAFSVDHSLRAPAVGYRVRERRRAFFYVPDVAALPERHEALHDIALYIGDGATIRRSMVRKRDGVLTGHAPITTQLDWCEAEGVRRAIFTHCGSPIVRGNAREMSALVHELGRDRSIDARIAHDGLALSGKPLAPNRRS